MIVYEKRDGDFLGKINDDAFRGKTKEEIKGHLIRATQIICENERKRQEKNETA